MLAGGWSWGRAPGSYPVNDSRDLGQLVHNLKHYACLVSGIGVSDRIGVFFDLLDEIYHYLTLPPGAGSRMFGGSSSKILVGGGILGKYSTIQSLPVEGVLLAGNRHFRRKANSSHFLTILESR